MKYVIDKNPKDTALKEAYIAFALLIVLAVFSVFLTLFGEKMSVVVKKEFGKTPSSIAHIERVDAQTGEFVFAGLYDGEKAVSSEAEKFCRSVMNKAKNTRLRNPSSWDGTLKGDYYTLSFASSGNVCPVVVTSKGRVLVGESLYFGGLDLFRTIDKGWKSVR